MPSCGARGRAPTARTGASACEPKFAAHGVSETFGPGEG